MPEQMKIILGGAPHSGKSCLRFALKEALKARQPACPYPYVITACPDGEGAWFHESSRSDPALALQLKDAYKKPFTEAHANKYASDVERCSLPLTLIDIGGRIDDKNRRICAHASHAILVAGNAADFVPWRNFCLELGISLLAEIHSDYHGKYDHLPVIGEDGVYRGAIHHLERGDLTLPERPTVQLLANLITGYFLPPKV